MTPTELQKSLTNRRCPSLLMLHGEDLFSLERLLARIVDLVVPPDARDFNLTTLHGRDTNATLIVENLRTYPVFSDRRLVLVRDLQSLPAAELDKLITALHDPVPEAVLVLIVDKIDGRRKFYQEFKKHGELVEFRKLYENQLPTHVRELARELGITLTEGGLALFCRKVGANLHEVYGELQKLAAYLGNGNLADIAEVAAVVSTTREETLFDFNDAVGRGEGGKALQLLGALAADGTPPLVILSMLVRHFRTLWKIGELSLQGSSRNEIQQQAGVNPYFLDNLMHQARRFPVASYPGTFERFLQLDLAFKSSSGDPFAHLELLVVELTGATGK